MRLADLLAQVHKELREAERPPEPGSFVLESCDISLGVEVTTGGSGELEFSIFGTGGKVGGEAKRAASHNLSFRFRPFRDGLEDLAAIIAPGLEVDVMRAPPLAAVLVLDVGRALERIGRAAKAALHAGNLLPRYCHSPFSNFGRRHPVARSVKLDAPVQTVAA